MSMYSTKVTDSCAVYLEDIDNPVVPAGFTAEQSLRSAKETMESAKVPVCADSIPGVCYAFILEGRTIRIVKTGSFESLPGNYVGPFEEFGLAHFEATLVRSKLMQNNDPEEEPDEEPTEEPWDGKNTSVRICDFSKDGYEFLSNFYEAPITFGGLTFSSSEAAFQAQKCVEEADKVQFSFLSPTQSKKLGRKIMLRPDWELVKSDVMMQVVESKFKQNPDLCAKLVATGDKKIYEGNTWHDTTWGVDLETGAGENRLGRILMLVRDICSEQGK